MITNTIETSMKLVLVYYFASFFVVVSCLDNDGYTQMDVPPPEAPATPCATDSQIVAKVTEKYNKVKIPGNGGVEVEVECWVQEVTSISDATSDVKLDLYMSELWLDPALRFDHLNPCKQNISLNNELVRLIWTPNTCFVNSKEAQIHESPFRNVFFMLYPNAFPFDTIHCLFTYESFNYNAGEVRLRWSPVGAQKMREKMEIADYELLDIAIEKKEELFPAGTWHDLHMTFEFKRRYGWYILQAYLPTYLQICISWIAFALGTKNFPARTMLGVNSLLSMTMQFGNVISNLPRVSYVKAIDVWMLTCMTFVFCTLIELACIGLVTGEISPSRLTPPIARVFLSKFGGFKRTILMLFGYNLTPPTIAETRAKNNNNNNNEHKRIQLAQPAFQPAEDTKPLIDPALRTTLFNPLFCESRDGYEYRPPGMGMRFMGSLTSSLTSSVGHGSMRVDSKAPLVVLNHDAEDKAPISSSAPKPTPAQLKAAAEVRAQLLALRIDKLSARIFPSLFALFNVFYWWFYFG